MGNWYGRKTDINLRCFDGLFRNSKYCLIHIKSTYSFVCLYFQYNFDKMGLVLLCNPANTKHLYKIYTTSAQRLRSWADIV